MKIMTGVLMALMVATGHAAQPKKTAHIEVPAHYHSKDVIDRRGCNRPGVLELAQDLVTQARMEYAEGKAQRYTLSTGFYNPANDAARSQK